MREMELIGLVNQDLKNLILKTFNIDEGSISNTIQLTNGGLLLDSMQIILLITTIEKHFNIRFDKSILVWDSFKDVETLSHLLVQKHKSQLLKKYTV